MILIASLFFVYGIITRFMFESIVSVYRDYNPNWMFRIFAYICVIIIGHYLHAKDIAHIAESFTQLLPVIHFNFVLSVFQLQLQRCKIASSVLLHK